MSRFLLTAMCFRRIYLVQTYPVIFSTFSFSTHSAYFLFSSFPPNTVGNRQFSHLHPPQPHPLPPIVVFSTKFLLLQQLNVFLWLSLNFRQNLKTLSPNFHNTFITGSSHSLLTQHWIILPSTPIVLLSHCHGVKVLWSILGLTCQVHLVYL